MNKQNIRMFDANVAQTYGVDEAIFIERLAHRIEVARGYKACPSTAERVECVITGEQAWVPVTVEEFCEELPWWTYKQIRRIINSCIKQNLIETSHYGIHPFDRRLWYTIKEGGSS